MTKWIKIRGYARKMRKNPTDAERKMWKYLRNRQLGGYKFLRQHPILCEQRKDHRYYFIPDFHCVEKKLIIELDGKIHDFQKEYDYNREFVLNEMGLEVLRFKNRELRNIERVKRITLKHLNKQ